MVLIAERFVDKKIAHTLEGAAWRLWRSAHHKRRWDLTECWPTRYGLWGLPSSPNPHKRSCASVV